MSHTTALALVAAAALAAATGAAACPDWSQAPTFGQIDLNAGFTPDPYVRNITAGGTYDLARCFPGNGWNGAVTIAPDFDLYWNGTAQQLTLAVEAQADSVLLINAPDGTWHFFDDYRGFNPAITFYAPQAGLYDIWVGTYDGSRRNPGRLIVTEFNY